MARALRRVTVERGIDGRDCTLLAFGGGGPMHAAGLADLYGIAEVIVPPSSSAFSALGCLVAELSFLEQRTVRLPLRTTPPEVFVAIVSEIEKIAAAPLGGEAEEIAWDHVALMRYAAQSDAMPVAFSTPLDPAALERDFQARHRELYGYATTEPPVVESLRVRARRVSEAARTPPPAPPTKKLAVPARGAAQKSSPAPLWGRPGGGWRRTRTCSFESALNTATPIIPREKLTTAVPGPAIIEDSWSTIVVPPNWRAHAEKDGHLVLTRAP
jgi:N-methylhydantoinase A